MGADNDSGGSIFQSIIRQNPIALGLFLLIAYVLIVIGFAFLINIVGFSDEDSDSLVGKTLAILMLSGSLGGIGIAIIDGKDKLIFPRVSGDLELGFIADVLIGGIAALSIAFFLDLPEIPAVEGTSTYIPFLELFSSGILAGIAGRIILPALRQRLEKHLADIDKKITTNYEYSIGLSYLVSKNWKNAVEMFDRSIEKNPVLLAAHSDKALALTRIAIMERKLGYEVESDNNIEKARKTIDHAIEISKTNTSKAGLLLRKAHILYLIDPKYPDIKIVLKEAANNNVRIIDYIYEEIDDQFEELWDAPWFVKYVGKDSIGRWNILHTGER